MKHIVVVSNFNLKRNANCLMINGNVGKDVTVKGMEVESKRYKLSY